MLGPLDVACQSVSLDPLLVLEARGRALEPQEDLGLQVTLDPPADFQDVEDLPVDHQWVSLQAAVLLASLKVRHSVVRLRSAGVVGLQALVDGRMTEKG